MNRKKVFSLAFVLSILESVGAYGVSLLYHWMSIQFHSTVIVPTTNLYSSIYDFPICYVVFVTILMVLTRVLSPSWFDKEFSPKNHNNTSKKDTKNRDNNKPNIRRCPGGDTNGNKE